MAYKFTNERRRKYLEGLSRGLRRGAAAKAAGVDRGTIRNAQKSDEAFATSCEEAEMDACDQVEEALWKKALDGNVTAMLVWLFNRSAGRFSDKRYVKEAVKPQDMTIEQLKEALRARGLNPD